MHLSSAYQQSGATSKRSCQCSCRLSVGVVAMMQVEIGEAGELTFEEQIDLAGGAMAILLNQKLGAIMDIFHVALPFLNSGVEFVVVVEGELLGGALLEIVFIA